MKVKYSNDRGEHMYRKANISQIMINCIFMLFSLCCILPIILLVSASFTSESAIIAGGYGLFPREFSMESYRITLLNPRQIFTSYTISVSVTVLGTSWALFICSMLAYVISRRDFALRNIFSFILFFTMMFNGGMVPFYILVSKYLHL